MLKHQRNSIIPIVIKEKRIVAQRRHGDADLAQVVEVLKYRDLPQKESMSNTLSHHKSSNEMLHWSGLTTMRSKHKSI